MFEIRKVYGKPIKTYPSGTIPYISGARDNNGCIGFVSAPDNAISEGNCISVDPITGASKYQPEKFVGRGFSGASVNTLYSRNINSKNALYLCGAIEKMASGVASYSHLLNGKKLANAEISLPCLQSGAPDYALMETYTRALEKLAVSRMNESDIMRIRRTRKLIHNN